MKQNAGINYNIELLANVLSQGDGKQGRECVFAAGGWIARSYMAIIGDVRS